MMIPSNVHQILRIFDNPAHPHYGPVRRLWVMLEQLFPEGVARFETKLKLFDEDRGHTFIKFDEHLADLMDRGLSEADAQRTVLQQLFVAREWIS